MVWEVVQHMLDIIETKYALFSENTRLLFEKFQINPLLYGSLGLEVLLQMNLNSDDIDILIPGAFLKENWESFRTFLEKNGYVLIDLHEHTFVKDGKKYAYACIEELQDFAGVHSFTERDHCLFLTLRDYLTVYEASLKDGYRQSKKNNSDLEKIHILKKILGQP